jgi:hypothetical protein
MDYNNYGGIRLVNLAKIMGRCLDAITETNLTRNNTDSENGDRTLYFHITPDNPPPPKDVNLTYKHILFIDYMKQNMGQNVEHGFYIGRTIAQAVGRWLSKAAARVRARIWSCVICGGQSGAGAGFY